MKINIDVTLLGHEPDPSQEQKDAFFAHCFDELYLKFFSIAYDHFNDPLEAEEYSFAFFEKLMIWSIGHFKDRQNLAGYILRAMRNYCLDILRERKRNRNDRAVLPIELSLDVPDERKLIDQNLITSEVLAHVRQMMAHLPDAQRQALILYAEGYTHQEIAEKLNISQSASTSRVNRARQNLLALLQAKTPADAPASPSP